MPKHILFLPRWYPHKLDPMFGLFVKQHAIVAATDYKVSVLYVHFVNQKSQVETQFIHGDIDELFFYILKRNNPFLNLYFWVAAYLKGLNLIKNKNGKIDITHVHVLTRLGVWAFILFLFKGIPYVITEHWTRYLKGHNFKGFFRTFFTRLVVKYSNAITTPSHQLSEAMNTHGIHGNFRVLSNVVSKKNFYPENKKVNSTFQLIHISCFTEVHKNMSGILRTMQQLKSLRTDFHLTMVGTGTDFDATYELAKKLDLLDVISFTGMLQGEALASKLRQSDLLIMFSHYENLPVVISEALCCGIPVVSSDVGGIREVLSDDLGILVPAGNEMAFLDAIQRIMNNPAFYSSENIALKAAKIWYEDAVLKQLNSLYSINK